MFLSQSTGLVKTWLENTRKVRQDSSEAEAMYGLVGHWRSRDLRQSDFETCFVTMGLFLKDTPAEIQARCAGG